MLSSINFPWVGRNPVRLAALIWIFVFVLSAPMLAVASLTRHPWFALFPFIDATGMSLIFLAISLGMRSLMSWRTARDVLPAANEEFRSDCRVVKGLLSMPGFVAVREDRLHFTPVFGEPFDVPFSQIRGASEKQLFNGNLLFGSARGYWLTVPGRWRLGVAVEDAETFRSILERHRVVINPV